MVVSGQENWDNLTSTSMRTMLLVVRVMVVYLLRSNALIAMNDSSVKVILMNLALNDKLGVNTTMRVADGRENWGSWNNT